jgi:hypothetical protein
MSGGGLWPGNEDESCCNDVVVDVVVVVGGKVGAFC